MDASPPLVPFANVYEMVALLDAPTLASAKTPVAVAVTVSVPMNPDNVPTVTAPDEALPSYTFVAMVGVVTDNAFAVIDPFAEAFGRL